MELKEFKKYIFHLDEFSASEVDDFEFMNNDELEEYQNNLEIDAGCLSEWDHLRAFITLKMRVEKLLYRHETILNKEETEKILKAVDITRTILPSKD